MLCNAPQGVPQSWKWKRNALDNSLRFSAQPCVPQHWDDHFCDGRKWQLKLWAVRFLPEHSSFCLFCMPDSVSEIWSSKEEDILNPQPSYWLLCIATKKKKSKCLTHTHLKNLVLNTYVGKPQDILPTLNLLFQCWHTPICSSIKCL